MMGACNVSVYKSEEEQFCVLFRTAERMQSTKSCNLLISLDNMCGCCSDHHCPRTLDVIPICILNFWLFNLSALPPLKLYLPYAVISKTFAEERVFHSPIRVVCTCLYLLGSVTSWLHKGGTPQSYHRLTRNIPSSPFPLLSSSFLYLQS